VLHQVGDYISPLLRPILRHALLLALCLASLTGCSFSIGVTNSPPVPNVGSGPANDRR
jgi:hypothetical protein